MMEFIKSCLQWVAENHDKIIMTVTSAQFVSLISAIVLIVKSCKKTDANVLSSKTLDKTLADTNNGLKKVDSVDKNLVDAKNEITMLKAEFEVLKTETADSFNTILGKVNAMLEVQSVVYSTIKNDTVRDTVNNLLVNARYAETATRAKLKQEVEELKVKVNERVNDVMGDVAKAAEVIESAISTQVDNTIMRY